MKFLTNKKVIVPICFAIFILIVILPPIMYGYIYPNLGDDSATHLSRISKIVIGQPLVVERYGGYIYIGYPLVLVSNLTHISQMALWNWFNCLILIVVGAVFYFIVSKLFNWKFGLLALAMTFISASVLEYVYWGVVFNLINVAIFMPMLIYLVSCWLVKRRIYQLVLILLLTALIVTFHTSGVYVPFTILLAVFIYIAYKIYKKERWLTAPVLLGLGIVIVGVIGVALISRSYVIKQFVSLLTQLTHADVGSREEVMRNLSISFVPYIMYFVTIPLIAILGVSLYALHGKWAKISGQVKSFLFMSVCLLVVLGLMGFAKLSTDPTRQEVDFAIILSIVTILITCCAFDTKWWFVWGFLITWGVIYQMPAWCGNNSAVKSPDKQAIDYVNNSGFSSYSCSSTVSYWIYDKFTKVKYSLDSNLLIIRNLAMTEQSTVGDVYYIPHGADPDSSYQLVKDFNDGKVDVKIYERR